MTVQLTAAKSMNKKEELNHYHFLMITSAEA